MIRKIRVVFPDLRYAALDILAEGDMVATRTTITGTHRGDFMGLAATGRSATLGALQLFKLEDGLIREGWAAADVRVLQRQLGDGV